MLTDFFKDGLWKTLLLCTVAAFGFRLPILITKLVKLAFEKSTVSTRLFMSKCIPEKRKISQHVTCHIDDLPLEIKLMIINQLDVRSILRFSATSKIWRSIIMQDTCLWKYLLQRDFSPQMYFNKSSKFLWNKPSHVSYYHSYRIKYVTYCDFRMKEYHSPVLFDEGTFDGILYSELYTSLMIIVNVIKWIVKIVLLSMFVPLFYIVDFVSSKTMTAIPDTRLDRLMMRNRRARTDEFLNDLLQIGRYHLTNINLFPLFKSTNSLKVRPIPQSCTFFVIHSLLASFVLLAHLASLTISSVSNTLLKPILQPATRNCSGIVNIFKKILATVALLYWQIFTFYLPYTVYYILAYTKTASIALHTLHHLALAFQNGSLHSMAHSTIGTQIISEFHKLQLETSLDSNLLMKIAKFLFDPLLIMPFIQFLWIVVIISSAQGRTISYLEAVIDQRGRDRPGIIMGLWICLSSVKILVSVIPISFVSISFTWILAKYLLSLVQ
ncbi:hypothetical protein MP638_006120 [Amoeboaphelidium occidentale]|nr:hypothetical protein MP638_006120 [Amoeboaphelidium occidentale]